MTQTRKWLPTLGELIDRLSIHQLKEVFIPENKENYGNEMKDMVHDIDLILKEHMGEITRSNLLHHSVISNELFTFGTMNQW